MSNAHGSKWIRPAKRWAIYARDGLACTYCGTAIEDMAGPATLDHVVPREVGGGNAATNLVCSCLACNSAKQDFSMRRFFSMLRDRGIDTSQLSRRISRLTSKPIDVDLGRSLVAGRKRSQ